MARHARTDTGWPYQPRITDFSLNLPSPVSITNWSSWPFLSETSGLADLGTSENFRVLLLSKIRTGYVFSPNLHLPSMAAQTYR